MSDLPLRLQLVTGPADEPVSVAEAKQHARIDSDEEDTVVAGLIVAARELAENFTRRAFLTQTWKVFLDAWPCSPFELPRAPLQQVLFVKTYDDADVATTLAASNYYVDTATRPGRLVKRASATWPTPARVANGIEIEFVCGYGDEPDDVPQAIKQGMYQLIAWLYEHRGDDNQLPPASAYSPLTVERTWLV